VSRCVWLPHFRAAIASGEVWLGPAGSGVTPVGRRRGACGSGPFPAAPGPNRTGAFQRIRLSSGCHVQFAAGFRLPRARRIPVTVSVFCITHTSRYPVILSRLAPFALRAAFPPSAAGRYSRDYYGASVTAGLAPRPVIPRSSLSYVLARRRPPYSSPWLPSLGIVPALEVRPHPTPCGRSAGHRFRASFRWGQGLPRLEARVQAIQL
jgi:hypothetical protein